MGRRLCQLIAAVVVSVLPFLVAVGPARADNAGSLLAMVNALRAQHRVGPLYADPTLTSVAQGWSAHMAAGAGLVHNPNEGAQLNGGWTKLGENVGEGGSISAIFNAFVQSPFHLSNMIDPTFNLTGIGVAVGPSNTLWVTEDFEAKPGATPATTAPPATTATTSRPTTTTVPAQRAVVTTTTAPPTTTVPPTVAPTTTTAVASSGDTTGVVPGIDLPPTTSAPSRLVPVAALTAHAKGGGSPSAWVLALSLLALASIAGAAYFVARLARPKNG